MRTKYRIFAPKKTIGLAGILLFGAALGFGQQQVNLTAGATSVSLPDGSTVPMWGYSCGAAVSQSTATCAASNTNAGSGWSPVVITVPTGQGLTINLTNNLSVPTSLVVVGQVGGGLGDKSQRTTTVSPAHGQSSVTWSTITPGTFAPPPQGPRVQSFSTEVGANSTTPTALTWANLRPGTYLIESGTHPSIQGPMGLYGILVVTSAPNGTTAGAAYPGVSYNAEVPLLLSEIDPVQNNAVQTAVGTAGFSETAVWSGKTGSCGDASVHTCYPPAVNYTPLYYLINGVAFDKTNSSNSVFPALPGTAAAQTSGTVLVRLVNAGLRMHVPSIVGSQAGTTSTPGFSLIAEDGNLLPGIPRVQSEVFMAAGKTYDVLINAPSGGISGIPISTPGSGYLSASSTPGVGTLPVGISGGGGSGAQATATVAGGVITAINVTNAGNGYATQPTVTIADAGGSTGSGFVAGTVSLNAGTVPVYDRELSLSGNATNRDAGMLAYIGVNNGALPAAGAFASAVARNDSYVSVVPGQKLKVSDPSKGVIANDTNVYGVKVSTPPTSGTLVLSANGTFTYTPDGTWTATASPTTTDSFVYQANGSGPTATVTLALTGIETSGGITAGNITYTANTATYIAIKTPGVLSVDQDSSGFPLKVAKSTVTPAGGLTVYADANGGFTAVAPGAGTYAFTYQAQNSQGTLSGTATVTLIFPPPSNLQVSVVDGKNRSNTISDYRWIVEEDRTFYIDPKCTRNPPAAGCATAASGIVPTLGTNFHTSNMPFVAQGCTGPKSCEAGQTVLGVASVCDVGNGACRPGNQKTAVNPSQVVLDPTKRYYISVLPGDSADPFYGKAGTVGHGMGGAPIAAGQTAVTVLAEPSPYPPAKLSVFIYEDDFPLNGEQDGGAGISALSSLEQGLGGFQIHLWDAMGGNGDFTGQMSYDMFNQPLSNSLDGTIDPNTGKNACPITQQGAANSQQVQQNAGITGMIVTCPKFEADGTTPSPLAGQAVIANLMPGRWGVIATAGSDRISRGEEWLQTNTLDGQKAHDAFTRISEPSYFQEFGPAGYHVSIGFANPAIINARKPSVCSGNDPFLPLGTPNCTNTITGKVTGQRLSRTPDERLYSSGSHDTFGWSQCYVSFGDADGEDFAFTKCDADGKFTLTGLPDGDWRVTTFDQWNDQLVDGLSTPVRLSGGKTVPLEIASTQWQTNLYTRTFIDDKGTGIPETKNGGIPLVNVAVRLRDGSLENLLGTDFDGVANFNETFPLFSWYTVETDTTRYKNTGTHVVYDAGGPADGSPACGQPGNPPCGNSAIGKNLANTVEQISVPANLRVPGAVYCADADCPNKSIQNGPGTSDSSSPLSTGRIDPPWVGVEGWQGFPGQNNFLEFGKEPYAAGENGGIKGHVVYASTRPFDDPQLLVQTQWEPLVPRVTINLYQEGFAADGVTPTLILVDHTQTSSFDDWAQGFHKDANGNIIPNMNCPGQGAATGTNPDLFFFSLKNQPNYLDLYNYQHGGTDPTPLPFNSQFKCYDGMHNWNQLQPAPYDGMYQFPSVASTNPTTGRPNATNCSICKPNKAADPADLYYGLPMLPTGKYVVEVVLPQGYELVKEEDKNILIGDNYIAPVTQEFGSLGNIFILPDQASVASAYNSNNDQNPTQSLGAQPANGIVPGFVPEPVWPCVGEARVVPDYISLSPQSQQVAPFAGATRNLCDRKEVTLGDQMGAIAKFYIYTSTHIASKFTGGITDDYTSEFDPFSPQFGEKFAPPDLPVSFKDWTGAEISRTYADHWGAYDGMTYSTWEVNPPNPTGYSPTMMVVCMNDPGPIPGPNGTMITDPLFAPGYSQFCYELPFMPGTTQYLDTPVVPTAAFAGAGYNNVDCAYPDTTPAIASVTGDVAGPWVSAAGAGHSLTIKALGPQTVPNYGYSGPAATTAPFNQKTMTRNYGFGTTTGTVTIGGVRANVTGWADSQITVTVPGDVPHCAVQQQAQYGGLTARCGELVVTRGDNLKQSIDAITVTIGGKPPTVMTAGQTIESAIDAASPGDLIIVPSGTYNELVLMWKPVRLQGVGAASSILNANTHPSGKLDAWRRQVNCLFGLAINGQAITSSNPFDSPNDNNGNPFVCPSNMQFQVDRMPLEATVGWDAELNGNLAEQLQEPSLMGALEGAAITVLAKGVDFHGQNAFATSLAAGFPTGTTLLTSQNCASGAGGANAFPSNFQCNPSSIDGLGITNSSQGGGGIFVHGWGHNLEISNNRIYGNSGTLSGGINVGQGEFPPSYLQGNPLNAAPGSCETSPVANVQLPYCHNLSVNVHNNSVSLNSSTGDELFSATPAGAGGVSFCTGADYYKFNYNWVCGNLSSGDGGGLGHLGFSKNGDIEHNSILFNQSTNPTIAANGGGIVIMGTPDVDPPCLPLTDSDCVAPLGSVGPSDGAGPGLVINANLIMGNAAESGSGGGLRMQNLNGSEVIAFPDKPEQWYSANVTNNIIADNIAGWDGGGISLVDALNVNIVNNTIVSNDTTASAGSLFNTVGAPLASSQGPCPGNQNPSAATPCITASTPQPAGLVSIQNSAVLGANFPKSGITCPAGHYAGTTAKNGTCGLYSYPVLADNVFWQNASYYIGVGALSPQFQQNVVTLYNAFTTTPAPNQPQADAATSNGGGVIISGGTGACAAANYWDIGVRGDTGPSNHKGGLLAPTYSVLTDAGDYAGLNNSGANPTVVSQYCNGSRVPPEAATTAGGTGWAVPPGISDATVPNPIFNLTPVATVDEGNNWVNMRWGPLSMVNPTTGYVVGNYALAAGSPAIDYTPSTFYGPLLASNPALATDFFGNPRPNATGTENNWDVGAVETDRLRPQLSSVVPNVLVQGNASAQVTLSGLNLTTTTAVNVPDARHVTVTGFAVVNDNTVTATLNLAANVALGNRYLINVTTPKGTSNNVRFSVIAPTAPLLTGITPNIGARGSVVPVTISGAGMKGATTVNVSGAGGSIVVGALTVSTDGTALSTTFTVAANAGFNSRNVSVTTPGGTSNTVTFTVVAPPGPTVTEIIPNIGLRGANNVPVTITGANLSGATSVNVNGGGVTFGPPTVSGDGKTLTTTFTIAPNARTSARTVTVQTPNGTSGRLTFTVQGTTLSSILPAVGSRGATVPLVLTGTNLSGGTVNVSDSNISVGSISVSADGTTLKTTFAIGAGTGLGTKTISVTAHGTSQSVTFRVLGARVAFGGPTPALNPNPANTAIEASTITVSNNAGGGSAGPLTLTAAPAIVQTSGSGAFSILPGGTCISGAVVDPGASCTVNVQYTPSGTGTSTAHITITDTGGTAATQSSGNFNAN